MILADLHIHSNFSDGRLSIPELVDLYGARGFGCIAITDHICEEQSFMGFAASALKLTLNQANFPLYMQILQSEAERAWDQYKMIVIPGFEISKNSWSNHRSAHILGLGVSKFLAADDDIYDVARKIQAMGALSIAAHPVSTGKFEKQTYHLWHRREEMRDVVDAWEVASGPILFDQVLRSDLPKIASSDLHHPKQIQSWKSVLDCEKHPEAILQAIRDQNVSFQFYKEVEANDGIGVPWSDGLGRIGLPHAYGHAAHRQSLS